MQIFSLTMNSLRSLHIKKNEKGQALVELALTIMLLVLLVFGITEFGRAMYTKNTLTNAARAGARAAAVKTDLKPMTNTTLDCASADPVQAAVCTSIVTGIKKENVDVTLDVANSPAKTNDTITVTVRLTGYESLVPILIPIASTLTGEASMRYE